MYPHEIRKRQFVLPAIVDLYPEFSDREAKQLCWVEVGRTLQLDVRRAGMPVGLTVVAETRSGL